MRAINSFKFLSFSRIRWLRSLIVQPFLFYEVPISLINKVTIFMNWKLFCKSLSKFYNELSGTSTGNNSKLGRNWDLFHKFRMSVVKNGHRLESVKNFEPVDAETSFFGGSSRAPEANNFEALEDSDVDDETMQSLRRPANCSWSLQPFFELVTKTLP